jgi:hypothetical protein
MARKAVKQASSHDPVFFAILSLALLLRSYHFGYPFWDYFASRQAFNLMIVRAYVHHGISLFRPTLDWLVLADPSRPSYFCGEFPWLHALAAIEMRVLPLGDWGTRLIPVAFSLAGLWWIYDLTRRVAGQSAARFAALAWAVLPFSVFFGRAFMSDVPALSLAAGTLDEFCSWLDTRRPLHFLAFALLGCLAVLTKPQVVAFGLVVVYLAFLEFRWQALTEWRLYIAAVVIVLPVILWIHHAQELSRAGGPPVIGAGMIGRSLHLWLQRSAWIEQWDRMFYSVLGPVALGLTAAGLFWPLRNSRHHLFHVWFLASALSLLLIPEAIVGWNDYYLLLLIPPASGLIGIALGRLYEHRAARATVPLLSMALAISSILAARPLFHSDELHYHLGLLLNRLTLPNDLIATSAGGAPDPLYFSERRGWEAAKYDLSSLNELSAAGASLFAIADPDAIGYNRALVPLLDRRFRRLTQDHAAGWMIWSLNHDDFYPNHAGPEKAGTTPVVDFSNKIALQGASIRELLIWPASFEVTYNWQCLSKIDINLRVFVHVTTPEGQTVFQQDHWPLGGHLLTPQWSVGNAIRERYAVVLPGGLGPGRYQLRVGWFDPASGRHLPIVGGASDDQDRATVAEFQVQQKPPSGWFSAE